MATLRQAVERQREHGSLPSSGVIVVGDLFKQFEPSPRGSVRALLSQMYGSVSKRLPWAVILCRFKGETPNPALEGPIEQFYRGIFTPGTGGLVEYWRDVSLGAIEIVGSQVIGWVELDIPRSAAGIGSNENRSTLVDRAISAAQRNQQDPLQGFHSQIAVLAHNWAIDNVPPGSDWRTPGWSQYWIDGSADGRGKVTLTPPHNGNITAHEMGHGFGMQHDVSADFETHYADPCCIMSQNHSFFDPAWNADFGPAVCYPHLTQRGWMYGERVFLDTGDWMSLPVGLTMLLAPVTDPGARANLGIRLTNTRANPNWDYYLEYARPTEWDQGLDGDYLFIRRIGPGKDIGPTPAILGSIPVPAIGTRAEFVEPSGSVRFQVEKYDPSGRIVQVIARKL